MLTFDFATFRLVAEHIVTIHGMSDGLFVVRDSSTVPGDFAVSMASGGAHFHFQMQRFIEGRTFVGYFIDDGPVFSTINKTVEHYRSVADGMPCSLLRYCARSSSNKKSLCMPTNFPATAVKVTPMRAGSKPTAPAARQESVRVQALPISKITEGPLIIRTENIVLVILIFARFVFDHPGSYRFFRA